MPTGLETTLIDLFDGMATSDRAPAGTTAACVAVAMGLGLFLKALHNPPTSVDDARANGDREHLESLRKRVLKLVATAAAAEATLPLRDADDEPANGPTGRLSAYRVARTLVDLVIQSLGQIQPILECGSTAMLADLEAAWRLQGAGLEAAIAACEDHLFHLPADLAGSETESLETQRRAARELQTRAESELAWRRGKV